MKDVVIRLGDLEVAQTLRGLKTQMRLPIRIDDTPITEAAARAGKRQRGIPSNPQNMRGLRGPYLKCDAPAGSATVSSRVDFPYEIGQRLWVKEPFCYKFEEPGGPIKEPPVYLYRASGVALSTTEGSRWLRAASMPRAASRLTLVVTDIRAERLRDISEADAIAEGARIADYGLDRYGQQRPGWSTRPTAHFDECLSTARSAIGQRWDETYGKRLMRGKPIRWDDNPWVWVLVYRIAELYGKAVS